MVNGLFCRFSSDTGHFKSKDSGDQREASALRDEVCELHEFSFLSVTCMFVTYKTELVL